MRMTTQASTTFIAALLGLAACSDPECGDNERKVGATCYPIGHSPDGSIATDDAGRAVGIDAGNQGSRPADAGASLDASGEPTAPPAPDGGTPADAQLPEAQTDSAVVDSGSAPITMPPDACPGGSANVCGGCDVLTHAVGDSCDNGGKGPCAKPASFQCVGKTLTCTPPAGIGTPEVCGDGIDNDCNGAVDDVEPANSPAWYPDCDGDGYAALESAVKSCSQPAATTACKGYLRTMPVFPSTLDCHDDGHNFHPGLQYGGLVLDNGTFVPGLAGEDADCNGVTEVSPIAIDISGSLDMSGRPDDYKPYCATPNVCETQPCVTVMDPSQVVVANCAKGSFLTAMIYPAVGSPCIGVKGRSTSCASSVIQIRHHKPPVNRVVAPSSPAS